MAITDNILSDKREGVENFLPLLDDFNPKAIAMEIARNMKQRRLEADLSQQALAKRSGVSLGTLKRFEIQSEISIKHLLMIAVALGATDEFHKLFTQIQYRSIDELIKVKKAKTRKRGRKNV